MLMNQPAQFIKTFVTDLDAALGKLKPTAKLTSLQKIWLGFCLTGILLTNSVCWAKFEPGRTQDCRTFVDVSRSKSSLGLFTFGECDIGFETARDYRERTGS